MVGIRPTQFSGLYRSCINAVLICSMIRISACAITVEDYRENGFAVSLLELPKSSIPNEDTNPEQSDGGDVAIDDVTNQSNVTFDAFNLLYIIASKIKSKQGTESLDEDPLNHHDIKIESTEPRPILRFSRRPVGSLLYSDASTYVIPPVILQHIKEEADRILANTSRYYASNVHMDTPGNVDLDNFDRIVVGNHIGFELYFRVEEDSGSGYLITGRSLDQINPSMGQRPSNTSGYDPSWFGVYVHARRSSYILQLEYRNIGWSKKNRFEIRISETFRKSQWQKLSLHIDFRNNLIDYWVNCSARPTIQVNQAKMKPTLSYSVFRVLQQRGSRPLPVKVTFRSAVVTSLQKHHLPQQCFSVTNDRPTPECSNGMVYMGCGPSCHKTCMRGIRSTPEPDLDDELQSCAFACVSGCMCPAGLVTHNGGCISPRQCPCVIGSKEYLAGSRVTINNELCTCYAGKWMCFAVPRFTIIPRSKKLLVGQNLTLTCGVMGNPLPQISWEVPTGVIYKSRTVKGGRISILMIRNITVAHNGQYSCHGRSVSANWSIFKTSYVAVLQAPKIDIPRGITVRIGEPQLTIDCKVSGYPPPITKWTRRRYDFADNTKLQYVGNVQKLKITDVSRRNSGEYECRAWNKAGNDAKSVRIIVELSGPYRMAFARRPVNQYVRRGHTALFNCQMIDHAENALNVTWFKDGDRLVIDGRKVVQRPDGLLVVRQVRALDAGTYACVIFRDIGEPLTAKADLMIKGHLLRWSEWSRCTLSCGEGGIMFKRRMCTGVPANKHTCKGSLIATRPCNNQVCPGHCSVIAGNHLTTFDGDRIGFQEWTGSCPFVLTQDSLSNRFKIMATISPCGGGHKVRCITTVTTIISLPNCSIVVELITYNIIKVNKVPVIYPYIDKTCPFFIDKIGNFLVLSVESNLEIKWAVPHRLYVTMHGKYHRRTKGLCGNYDFIPGNDRESTTGIKLDSDESFEFNWLMTEESESVIDSRGQYCDRFTRRQAHTTCDLLQFDAYTEKCKSKVGVIPYIGQCVAGICKTSVRNTNLLYCVEFANYAETCLRESVVLNWRSPRNCDISCGANRIYMECGPPCTKSCPGVVNNDGKLCVTYGKCMSGCHCSTGMVTHQGRCISPKYCPCIYDSVQYRNGSSHKRNCEKCTCINSKWKCSYNSQLCDFPAAVVKGPTSEIIPRGDFISLCCEAVGLPTPQIQWYHNNMHLVNENNIESVFGRSRSILRLTNVTDFDGGVYTCKAANELGSHKSEPNLVTVIGTFLNIGRCSSLSCYSAALSRNRSQCNKARHCCQPSVTSPVKVQCHHPMYDTSFIVTVVKACDCSACEERATVIEGILKTAHNSNPVKHAKIIYMKRVVAYTSDTGSFHVKFHTLPQDTRFVTLKFDDVYTKGFASVVKNLPVVVGDVTIHTVMVQGRSVRFRFNATNGLTKSLRPLNKAPVRYRLRVPPYSFYSDTIAREYRGIGLAVVTLLDGFITPHQAKLMPGSFIAIDNNAQKHILTPKVVVSISFFDGFGKPMHLKPDVLAEFLVSSYSLRETLLPWELDHVTGYWRKGNNRVGVRLKSVNKRGRKAIVFTSKIPRFTTSWCLGQIHDPCYIRAVAFNAHNESLSGVRISLTASDTTAATPRIDRRKPSKSYTHSEDITRVYDKTICLPMTCGHFGTLTASKQGNDLTFLVPDPPKPGMGRVSTLGDDIIDIEHPSDEFPPQETDRKYSPSPAYFRSEQECRETTPLSHNRYIFRENRKTSAIVGTISNPEDGNRMIQTFVINNPEQSRTASARRVKTSVCHMKVGIIVQESVAARGIIDETIVLEAVTFRAKSFADLSIVGWRRATFTTSKRPNKPQAIEIFTRRTRYTSRPISRFRRDVCIEYLCNNGKIEKDVVYLSAKPSDNITSGERSNCSFISASRASDAEDGSGEGDSASNKVLSNNGYVFFTPKLNTHYRTKDQRRRIVPYQAFDAPHARKFGHSFVGRSRTESYNFCKSSQNDNTISAWFTCS